MKIALAGVSGSMSLVHNDVEMYPIRSTEYCVPITLHCY